MKRKLFNIGSVIIVIIIVLIVVIALLLAFIPSRMTKKHTDKIVETYLNDMNYGIDNFKAKYIEKIIKNKLISQNGYNIPVYYILKKNSYDNKTIILVHWHESNHKAMYPIAEFFLEEDFNVVLYDMRAHGDNTAKTVTFGYYEKDDLKAVIDFVNSKMVKDNIIGVLGQSMGGATVGYYSGTEHAHKNIDFAIIDSGFTSMDEEITWQIDSFFIPIPTKFFTMLGNLSNKQIYGYSYRDVNVVKSMKNNSIPTLIIHSKLDNTCPYFMGKQLFDAIKHNNKQLITFDNSKHLCAFWDENEKYRRCIISFIEKYVKYKFKI